MGLHDTLLHMARRQQGRRLANKISLPLAQPSLRAGLGCERRLAVSLLLLLLLFIKEAMPLCAVRFVSSPLVPPSPRAASSFRYNRQTMAPLLRELNQQQQQQQKRRQQRHWPNIKPHIALLPCKCSILSWLPLDTRRRLLSLRAAGVRKKWATKTLTLSSLRSRLQLELTVVDPDAMQASNPTSQRQSLARRSISPRRSSAATATPTTSAAAIQINQGLFDDSVWLHPASDSAALL